MEETNKPTLVIRWLFYAFVFSLPFETAIEGVLEPTTIVGALLLLSTLLQPGLFLRWPPKGFWCFIVYLYVFAILCVLEFSSYGQLTALNLLLLAQLTILSWITYCVMKNKSVAERGLLIFAVGCAVLAVLQVTGVAGRPVSDTAQILRETAFGFHPNNLARILALGLIVLVGLTFGRAKSMLRPVYLVLPFVGIIGVALIQTGSRGGLLALAGGIMTLVLRRGTLLVKLLNAAGVVVLMAFFLLAAWQSNTMRARFEETLQTGDLARRDQIYPAALKMFAEKPIFGWGPITSTYELGARLGHRDEETKNPHNLILFGLVSTGLMGAIPLFTGIGLAMWSAWKTRSGPHGILPLAMGVVVLIANMSGLWLFNKLHWVVMAYALASIYHASQPAHAALPARHSGGEIDAVNYAVA